MQQTQERPSKVKFATQADPVVLDTLRHIAANEGRHIQALVDEALREYVERKTENIPRRHIVDSLRSSMARYDSLYKELAK